MNHEVAEAETEAKGGPMMASQNGGKVRVMIIEQNLDLGMKLADCLATNGYHPVYIRTVDAAIGALNGVRPQGIFVGIGCSGPVARINIAEALLMIQTVCPCFPVGTIEDQTGKDLTQIVVHQGGRRFLVKQVEFSQIGEMLQSELSVAAV